MDCMEGFFINLGWWLRLATSSIGGMLFWIFPSLFCIVENQLDSLNSIWFWLAFLINSIFFSFFILILFRIQWTDYTLLIPFISLKAYWQSSVQCLLADLEWTCWELPLYLLSLLHIMGPTYLGWHVILLG